MFVVEWGGVGVTGLRFGQAEQYQYLPHPDREKGKHTNRLFVGPEL